jgi:hypothetical protein
MISERREPVSRKEKSSAIREDPASPMYTSWFLHRNFSVSIIYPYCLLMCYLKHLMSRDITNANVSSPLRKYAGVKKKSKRKQKETEGEN